MTRMARTLLSSPVIPALALLLLLTVPLNAQYTPWNPIPAQGCSAYATSVIPVGIAQVGGGRYLSYGGIPGTRIMPIGVSPDNGCALYLNDTAICSQSITWQTVIDNLAAAGLNRLRVAVAFGHANDPRNTPFAYYTDSATCQTTGTCKCPSTLNPCFRLDEKNNQGFFGRLRAVVDKARSKNMFVEVTFFAPAWGDVDSNGDNQVSTFEFQNGPWGGRGAYLASDGTIKPVKFTSVNNFVLDVQTGDNLIMQTQFQANVIKWTVQELWCYDNIWWEIANEPESPSLLPSRVANWQKSLIANSVVPEDSSSKYPWLQRPHLIAVNVFSQATTAEFLGPNNPNVSIVNGHYAEVVNNNNDSGAIIYLAQANLNAGKVLGLNESKITKAANPGDKAYTRSLTNGTTVTFGGPDAARAEAWEFMLTRGGTVDHFGYLSGGSPGTVGPIAAQMNKLRTFMLTVPIGQVVGSSNPVPWATIGSHPDPLHNIFPAWNSARGSYKYWGALQTPNGTASPNRYFALYLHNSAPRCLNQSVNYTHSSPCSYLPINAPDARIWTTAGSKYKENNLQLNLGTAPGTFRICWYDPATLTPLSKQVCNWNGTSCGATVSSPEYSFDILLKIDEKSADPC